MDDDGNVIADGAVAINAGLIIALGPAADINAQYAASGHLPGNNHIVLPGLINGHSHAAMTLLRGVADDLALYEWLNNYIFPAEVKFVDAEFVPHRHRTRLLGNDPWRPRRPLSTCTTTPDVDCRRHRVSCGMQCDDCLGNGYRTSAVRMPRDASGFYSTRAASFIERIGKVSSSRIITDFRATRELHTQRGTTQGDTGCCK